MTAGTWKGLVGKEETSTNYQVLGFMWVFGAFFSAPKKWCYIVSSPNYTTLEMLRGPFFFWRNLYIGVHLWCSFTDHIDLLTFSVKPRCKKPTQLPSPIFRPSQWSWGDGAFVDENAQKCSVRTGADRNRLRAKVGFFWGKKASFRQGGSFSEYIWLPFFFGKQLWGSSFFCAYESGVSKWWYEFPKFDEDDEDDEGLFFPR